VSERWQTVRLDDVEPVRVAAAGVTWKPVRRTLGVEAFGINAYSAAIAGEHVVEEHSESSLRHEELYVVVRGHATFTLDDETVDAPAGTLVFVRDPDVKRAAVATEPGTTVLALGGKPGEPYSPSAWEWYFYAERYRAGGEHEAAIALLEDGLARFPDHAGMLYSLGCWEAMAGRYDAALEHVGRAVELQPAFKDWAAQDDDLASIRDDPRFPR